MRPTQTLRNRMVSDGTRLYFAGVSNATAPGSWAAAGTGFGADGVFSIAVNPSPAQSFTQICANTGPSDATGWYLSPDGASLFSNCGAKGPIAVASGNVYTTGQFLLSFPAAGSLSPTSPVNMFAPTFRFDHPVSFTQTSLIVSDGRIFWLDGSGDETLFMLDGKGATPVFLATTPGWIFVDGDMAAYKGKIYYPTAEHTTAGDRGYVRAVAMDGSDNGRSKNVSEPFPQDRSWPAYVYASDAGLFVVVIVRGPTASFEDYSLRVYLCSDPT